MDDGLLRSIWQQRTRDRYRPIGTVLGQLAGASWFKQQRHLGRIVEALEQLLPAGLTDHLAVEGFRQQTLHLRVDSAAHRYELEMAKEPLLVALNERVSGLFVRDIRLTLGKLDEASGRRGGDERPMRAD